MGWYFDYGTDNRKVKYFAQDRVDEINRDKNFKVIDHSVVGHHLWMVIERSDSIRFIELNLLAKSEGAWGYKPLDVYCGPCYYTCPKRLTDLCPYNPELDGDTDRQYGKNWYDANDAHRKQLSEKALKKRIRNKLLTYRDNLHRIKYGRRSQVDVKYYDTLENANIKIRNYLIKHNVAIPQ